MIDKKFFEEKITFLKRLPERDQHIIKMFMRGMNQKQIAIKFSITQGAVSSRFKKINKRIGFLETLDKFDLYNTLEDDLKLLGVTDFDISLVKSFILTTSQSITAKELNKKFSLEDTNMMNQVKVRYRYLHLLRKLKEQKDPLARKYCEFLSFVKDNIYMMLDLKLPQFKKNNLQDCSF